MKRSHRALARAIVAGLCLVVGVTASSAQGRGGGGPPGGGPGGGGMGGPGMGGGGGGMGGQRFPSNNPPGDPGFGGRPPQQPTQPNQGGEGQTQSRAGLQLGPPGRWWDDRGFARGLKLRPEQQTHMDAIFEQNRGALVSSFERVRQAEAQMEELSRSPAPDETALFQQIDRVAQARADLQKANTHMLLQLRKEMDADQIKRLEKAQK
jgi:Spy/CpxP family protein refolding chaperone